MYSKLSTLGAISLAALAVPILAKPVSTEANLPRTNATGDDAGCTDAPSTAEEAKNLWNDFAISEWMDEWIEENGEENWLDKMNKEFGVQAADTYECVSFDGSYCELHLCGKIQLRERLVNGQIADTEHRGTSRLANVLGQHGCQTPLWHA